MGLSVYLLECEDPVAVADVVIMLLRLSVAFFSWLLQALVGVVAPISLHRFQPLLTVRNVSQVIVEFAICHPWVVSRGDHLCLLPEIEVRLVVDRLRPADHHQPHRP